VQILIWSRVPLGVILPLVHVLSAVINGVRHSEPVVYSHSLCCVDDAKVALGGPALLAV